MVFLDKGIRHIARADATANSIPYLHAMDKEYGVRLRVAGPPEGADIEYACHLDSHQATYLFPL